MMAVTKGKNKKCKPSPNTGKVSAKTTEGASVSRCIRMEISVSRHVRMTAKGKLVL